MIGNYLLGASFWGYLCLTLAGCELGNTLGDVAGELSDPELESVETGGRQLASGRFQAVRFDGTAEDGAYVVGLRDGETLSITPFSGEGGCEAGEARRFQSALRRGDDAPKLDARIPFVTRASDDEPGELRFTNFECEVDELVLRGGTLPISTTFAADPGFISQVATGEVYYLNPWKNSQKKLASGAVKLRNNERAVFANGKGGTPWMWLLSNGQVIAYDSALNVQYQGGENLTEFAHSPSGTGGPMVALIASSGELSTALASDLSKRTVIDQAACGVGFNAGQRGRELLYFSPCEERRLIVYELETKTRRDFGPGRTNFRILGATPDGPVLMYVTDPDPGNGNIGKLWVRQGETAPILLGERGHLQLSRVSAEGQAEVVVNWTGQSGELQVGQLGEKLETIARGVASLSALGIVSDFDGNNGTLQRLDRETNELESLAKEASIHGIRVDELTERGLFLTRFDGQRGALTLLQGQRTRVLAENVRPGQYQFTALLPMVTVLVSEDPADWTAALELYHLERDETIRVSDGVSEVLEVGWPREGILYSVPEGERAGIWFARAQ